MKSKVKVNGRKEVMKNLDIVFTKIYINVCNELLMQGFIILSKSLPITPKDTGELRESGYVLLEEKKYAKGSENGSVEVISQIYQHKGRIKQYVTMKIGYKTEYAIKVHEWIPEPNWTTPGTGPKYLERPFKSYARKLHLAVFKAARKALKG